MTDFDKLLEVCKDMGFDDPLYNEMNDEQKALIISWMKRFQNGNVAPTSGVAMMYSVLMKWVDYALELREECK